MSAHPRLTDRMLADLHCYQRAGCSSELWHSSAFIESTRYANLAPCGYNRTRGAMFIDTGGATILNGVLLFCLVSEYNFCTLTCDSKFSFTHCVLSSLLGLHAFTGCDSASAFKGKGFESQPYKLLATIKSRDCG